MMVGGNVSIFEWFCVCTMCPTHKKVTELIQNHKILEKINSGKYMRTVTITTTTTTRKTANKRGTTT
jgi:hypothetical protein